MYTCPVLASKLCWRNVLSRHFICGNKKRAFILSAFLTLLFFAGFTVPAEAAYIIHSDGSDGKNKLKGTTASSPYPAWPGENLNVHFSSVADGCSHKSVGYNISRTKLNKSGSTVDLKWGWINAHDYGISLSSEASRAPEEAGLYRYRGTVASTKELYGWYGCKGDPGGGRSDGYVEVKQLTESALHFKVDQAEQMKKDKGIYHIPYNFPGKITLRVMPDKDSVDYNTLISCEVSGNANNGGYYLLGSKDVWSIDPDLVKPNTDFTVSGHCLVGSPHVDLTKTINISPVTFHRNEASMGEPQLVVDNLASNDVRFDWETDRDYALIIRPQLPNEISTPWEVCELQNSAGSDITALTPLHNKLIVNSRTLGQKQYGESREYRATCYVHRGKWDEQRSSAGHVTLTRNGPRLVSRRELSGSCFKAINPVEYSPGQEAVFNVAQHLQGDFPHTVFTMTPPEGWRTVSCPKVNGKNPNISQSGEACISSFRVDGELNGPWKVLAPKNILTRTAQKFEMKAANYEGNTESDVIVLDTKTLVIMPEVNLSSVDPKMTVTPAGDSNRIWRQGDKFTLGLSHTLHSATQDGDDNDQFNGVLDGLIVKLPAQLSSTGKPALTLEGKSIPPDPNWNGGEKDNLTTGGMAVKHKATVNITLPVVVNAIKAGEEWGQVQVGTRITGRSAKVTSQPHDLLYNLGFGKSLDTADAVFNSINMNGKSPLTFSPEITVQNAVVRFSAQKTVKQAQLDLTLPKGLARQGDITVTCAPVSECRSEIANDWTGTGQHTRIIDGVDMQTGITYQVSVPVQLDKTPPENIAALQATLGQSAAVADSSPDRVVAQNSTVTAQKAVKVVVRGTPTINNITAKRQILSGRATFIALVSVQNSLPTDSLTLTAGTQTVPMKDATCYDTTFRCYSAELPIPDNPDTYTLKAVLTDSSKKEIATNMLVSPSEENARFPSLLTCAGDDDVDFGMCSLSWGKSTFPAPIPFRANDAWLTIKGLHTTKRISDPLYDAFQKAYAGTEDGKIGVTPKNINGGWEGFQMFAGATGFAPQLPSLSTSKEMAKDEEGIIKSGGTLPLYGTLSFGYE